MIAHVREPVGERGGGRDGARALPTLLARPRREPHRRDPDTPCCRAGCPACTSPRRPRRVDHVADDERPEADHQQERRCVRAVAEGRQSRDQQDEEHHVERRVLHADDDLQRPSAHLQHESNHSIPAAAPMASPVIAPSRRVLTSTVQEVALREHDDAHGEEERSSREVGPASLGAGLGMGVRFWSCHR